MGGWLARGCEWDTVEIKWEGKDPEEDGVSVLSTVMELFCLFQSGVVSLSINQPLLILSASLRHCSQFP